MGVKFPEGPRVPVGPFFYGVQLTSEPIVLNGQVCDAICDTASLRFMVDARMPPLRRVNRFWHEFVHAVKTELDITDARKLDEESVCNLIGLGLTGITPHLYAEVWTYLMTPGLLTVTSSVHAPAIP